MKDDPMRRILQLERKVQDLTELAATLRNERRNAPKPGGRLAILQPVANIAARTESSGVFLVSHGDAVIFDLIVRDTTSAYEMKAVKAGSTEKVAQLANVSNEILLADEFVFAISYNGIYVNALAGEAGVYHAVTPIGGIPAKSGTTMGSASCDIYDCSSSGVLTDSTTNQTIYNPTTGVIAAETHIVAARNRAGLLVAIVEDCNA